MFFDKAGGSGTSTIDMGYIPGSELTVLSLAIAVKVQALAANGTAS